MSFLCSPSTEVGSSEGLAAARGRVEVHVVTFPSTGAFVAYRDDPRRAEWRTLLVESGAEQEIFELFDVPIE